MSNLLGKVECRAPCLACRLHRQSAFRLTRPAYANRRVQKTSRTRATDDSNEPNEKSDKDSHKSKKTKPSSLQDLNPVKLGKRSRKAINELLAVAGKADKSRGSSTTDKEDTGLDANPIKLGRKSRAVLDDLWKQFAAITSPTRTVRVTEQYRGTGEGMSEFETPQAAFTTVLVIGATGRVGKVLVRKLLLRGYKVKALVRPRSSDNGTGEGQRPAGVPESVEVIYGDVADFRSCLAALQDVDKIIYAAKSKSMFNVELAKVEEIGPVNIAKAFMDVQNMQAQKEDLLPAVAKRVIANFENNMDHRTWSVTHVGNESDWHQAYKISFGLNSGNNSAMATVNGKGNLSFRGNIYSNRGIAEVGSPLEEVVSEELAECEGFVLRCRGDGHVYSFVLTTGTDAQYLFRFRSQQGYHNIRMPFNAFRPINAGDPPLEGNHQNLVSMALRFELDGRNLPLNDRPRRGDKRQGYDGDSFQQIRRFLEPLDRNSNAFHMELDWIKALPGGEETDFIMVSCAGVQQDGLPDPQLIKQTESKRRGEQLLRNIGLGYTIIRAGALLEEPGGYQALIFDQGNRITQGISCADVADVCIKSLHVTAARNKTFEVCYEYTPEQGLEMYELVAHLPAKSNNYLAPALSGLQKNT